MICYNASLVDQLVQKIFKAHVQTDHTEYAHLEKLGTAVYMLMTKFTVVAKFY